MCGIAGVINGGNSEILRKMADIQAHRGPDDAGLEWFEAANSGLAQRRLSILDLSSAGHQPMKNARGNRWISFNGEIYNYRELRTELQTKGHKFKSNSDTEVILAAYDEWGASAVNRFNGMFALAIYDVQSRELFLARDHLGIKPLYYAQLGHTLLFASEAKSLFEYPAMKKEIEPDAVVSAIMLLWVPEPKTGFKNVFKLPAGHYATFKNGKFSLHEYWDVPIPESTPILTPSLETESTAKLVQLLEQAISRQIISDVPVGAFLSGGLDSSLIVALMRKAAPSAKLATYTIAFTEADKKMEAMPDDAMYARRVAKEFDTEHHELCIEPDSNTHLQKILWHLDDPVADGAAINTYLISKQAKARGTTVLLNGMGGDEVFGGYRKHFASLLIERYQKIPTPIRKGLIEPTVNAMPVAIGGKGIILTRWAKRFLGSASVPPLSAYVYGFNYHKPEGLREILADHLFQTDFEDLYPVRRYFELAERVKHLPLLQKMTYLDTKLFLTGINLIYSDKAMMAASVEGRPPLIDKEIVEFAAYLPSELKIKGRQQKYILKKAAESFLPNDIIYRPKAPFGTPLRAWMKTSLKLEMETLFSSNDFPHNRYIQKKYVRNLLDAHASGKADNAHALWGAFGVANWINQNETV